MKTCLAAVILCCAALMTAQTKEYPYTSGNAFLRLCGVVEKDQKTDVEMQQGTNCLLYIAGFVQGAEIGSTTTRVQQKQPALPQPFCRPDNVETAQLVKIVLKYVRENPEDAHQDTMLVAMWALQKAFPCMSK